MKREIKFRAWDTRKGLNKMYFNVSFIPYGDGWIGGNPDHKFYQIYHGNGGFFLSDMKDIVLMQFTGLHDKNGKEIYEGDIVQHNNWDYPFEVFFNQEKARFVCKMRTGLTQYIDYRQIVVIGNIYENPELIK
jgi:uncharacterized phage protein (TIGR01671 family)